MCKYIYTDLNNKFFTSQDLTPIVFNKYFNYS